MGSNRPMPEREQDTWSDRIGSRDSSIRATGPDRGDDRILRAKYLDWCSARVAERFLKLTPDEIYELAHRASAGDSGPPPRSPGGLSPDAPKSSASPAFLQVSAEEPASFRRIVEAVTEALASELKLPAFETWRASYVASPEQYDEELLGFWRERI